MLKDGYRTGDIMSDGCTKVGTARMGDLICERFDSQGLGKIQFRTAMGKEKQDGTVIE